jgi:outer membrane protein, heavy metal efflux system
MSGEVSSFLRREFMLYQLIHGDVASRLFLALATAALLPTRVWAQEGFAQDTLLARLTAEAIAASPALQQSRAVARASAARVRAAGALPDPMLSAGVMNLTLPRFAFRESDFTEVDVELSQEFPWPGTLGARTQVAEAQAKERLADAAARRREIVVKTAELYYRLRYVATARATLARQRTLLSAAVEIATSRYASASAPQSDPLQARVAVARLDAEDSDLAEQQASVGAQLKAIRNVRGSERLTIELIHPEAVQLVLHGGVRPLAQPESLIAHPRLAARRAEVEAAERTVTVEQLGGRPDFSITSRYGARPLGDDFFSAFVGVRVPLWAGRKQGRVVEAARADAAAARAALDEETVSLAAELESTLAQIASGERRLKLLYQQVLPSSQETVNAVLRSYRVGSAPFLNVLAAEDSLYRAQLEALMVAAEHFTHLVALEQLVSQGDAS